MVVHDEDGAARHLAAGAAGGGHGDDRGDAFGNARRSAFNRGVGAEWAFVCGRNRNALGAVDGGAATDRNQAVAAIGLVHLRGGAHRRFGRVGGGLVKHGDGQAGQGVQRFLQHACGLDARIGDDQRAADADAFALLFEQLDSAKLELNLGDVVDEGHGGLRCRMKPPL